MVMRALRVITPTDIRLRRLHRLQRRRYHIKGPSQVWHCDGYDKLKPYGFCIHGCIDGYSRRILWLEVGPSNNDPAAITRYFLDAVKQLSGVPTVLRCDLGTENSTLAFVQPFLRRNGHDTLAGENSFRYGKSVSNQRIEAWWGILRRWQANWWINFFKELKHNGLFDETNPVQVDSLRLSFMAIIQDELNSVAEEWNAHRIRPSRAGGAIAGIPDQLFFMPSLSGARTYLHPVNPQDVVLVEQFATPTRDPPTSEEFLVLAIHTYIHYIYHWH